jgi:hypothetical protein
MVGIQNSVLVLDSSDDFKIREISKGGNLQSKKSESPGHKPSCIAFDPQNCDRAYWGIFDNGLWKTDDRGQSWNNIGKDSFPSPRIMSVAVSSLNSGNRLNKVHSMFQMMEEIVGKD